MPNPVPHDYTLVALPLTVSYDSTDLASPLDDPTHGMRDSVSVAPTQLARPNRAPPLSSARSSAAAYFDLDHLLPTAPGRSVLAARALAGLAQGAGELEPAAGPAILRRRQRHHTRLPLSGRRAVNSGDGNIPIGGTAITAGALEFRQRFGREHGGRVLRRRRPGRATS